MLRTPRAPVNTTSSKLTVDSGARRASFIGPYQQAYQPRRFARCTAVFREPRASPHHQKIFGTLVVTFAAAQLHRCHWL